MTADDIRRRLNIEGAARDVALSCARTGMDTIAELLREGREQGLSIKEMAALAGITRQTAYNLLNARATT